jgi:hypothetical protein
VNEGQANQTNNRNRSLARTAGVRVLWFAMLCLLVAGLALFAVASSFPIPGGSEPRSGTEAIHESIGVVIMQVVHGPFAWLYTFLDGKIAGVLVWLFWATVLHGVSALVRRPRWVFSPRAQIQ